LNIKNMQHYALFRFQAGKTLGALSADPRGAACTLFPKSGGIKIAALLGRHLTPRLDLNGANIRRIFETCKHFRYFLREFKKRPTLAIAAGAGLAKNQISFNN
jgi:hypothetical protein